MTDRQKLAPAQQLAETNKIHFPNESAAYRKARNELLVEEIELRRHIERVALSMCTSFLRSWNGTAVNLRERVAMIVTARSPIERLIEYKEQRGFANLRFVSDMSGDYTRTCVNLEDADVPGFSVFSRRVFTMLAS